MAMNQFQEPIVELIRFGKNVFPDIIMASGDGTNFPELPEETSE